MVRSIDYAAWTALDRERARLPDLTPEQSQNLLHWRDEATKIFLDSCRQHIAETPSMPRGDATASGLLNIFLLEKLFYEIGYEAGHRPRWLSIPLRGARQLLDGL